MDEVRLWTTPRTSLDIMTTVFDTPRSVAGLRAVYSGDNIGRDAAQFTTRIAQNGSGLDIFDGVFVSQSSPPTQAPAPMETTWREWTVLRHDENARWSVGIQRR